jgi:zinc metalloprotease ZmpB
VKTAQRTIVLAIVPAAILLAATTAFAAKPGSGNSTGSGTVFAPNPVADLQNQSLTDQKDADYPGLAAAYHRVTLTNLDGSGFLRGDYANVVSETGNPAYSPTNEFHYRRDDDRFEQVMAYYWVTEAQKYIQILGFGSRLRPVNMESQDVRINQYGADNSFSWDKKDMMKFGKGGVDDAEDAEVILHELGHAIQDSQQDPFGYGFGFEARSIGEGFADYWAVTVADIRAPTPDPACVADWDSVSYTSTTPHCLRRVDLNLHYPENINPNSVHSTGRIWSRALWDIRKALGHVKADTIILEGHFGQRDPTMRQLAESTISAAERLYGRAETRAVRASFEARGIL